MTVDPSTNGGTCCTVLQLLLADILQHHGMVMLRTNCLFETNWEKVVTHSDTRNNKRQLMTFQAAVVSYSTWLTKPHCATNLGGPWTWHWAAVSCGDALREEATLCCENVNQGLTSNFLCLTTESPELWLLQQTSQSYKVLLESPNARTFSDSRSHVMAAAVGVKYETHISTVYTFVKVKKKNKKMLLRHRKYEPHFCAWRSRVNSDALKKKKEKELRKSVQESGCLKQHNPYLEWKTWQSQHLLVPVWKTATGAELGWAALRSKGDFRMRADLPGDGLKASSKCSVGSGM